LLGPLLAAIAAEVLSIRAPFWFLGALLLVVLALSARLDLTAGTVAAPRRAVRELVALPAMQATLCMAVAFYVTVGMFEAIWALLLKDHGAETWLIGLTLSLFTVPMIFLAPVGGRVAQRRGPVHVVTISLAVATVCTFSYGVVPRLWMLLAISLVHAMADSFTMPGNQVAAALASPPEHVSSAQGLLGATGLATAGATGLVSGVLYQEWGRFAVCTTSAAVMFLFVILARLRIASRTLQSSL